MVCNAGHVCIEHYCLSVCLAGCVCVCVCVCDFFLLSSLLESESLWAALCNLIKKLVMNE